MRIRIKKSRLIDFIVVLFIILIASIVLFNNLGKPIIKDWDEARHAQNALEILKTGDWIVLRYGYEPDLWNLKPPLGAWIIAISFKIFGISEFSLRLFSVLFGMGTLLVVYFFGKKISNRAVGIISALFLLTIPHFTNHHGARTGDYDILLTFFITLSLYLFYLYYIEDNTKYLLGIGVALGLCVLTKGIMVLFPIMIMLIFIISTKSYKKFINKKSLYSIFIFLIITLPWFIIRFFSEKGKQFLIKMIKYDILKRSSQAIEGHSGDWRFYLYHLQNNLGIFFTILFAISVFYSIYLIKKKHKAILLLIIWIAWFFLVFSIAKSKLFWYITPIYPAISLLIFYCFEDIRQRLKISKLVFFIVFILLIFLPITGGIEYIWESNSGNVQPTIKILQEDIKTLDNIYIHSKFNSQSTYFYLNSYVKEKVYIYKNLDNTDIKEGDGVLIFDKDQADLLSKDVNYEIVGQEGKGILFVKN